MKLVLALILACSLPGCGKQTRQSEDGQARGTFNGQPVALEWHRDAEGETTFKMPELQAAAGMLPSPWGDALTLITTLLAGGGVMAARSAAKRAAEHKADADEGWNRALAPLKPEDRA